MTNISQLPPEFAQLASAWNDLDPAQIDDSLYYEKGLHSKPNAKKDEETQWFRALCFTLPTPSNNDDEPVNTFKGKLAANEHMCCRIWMGINKERPVSYFEPFLEVFDGTPPQPITLPPRPVPPKIESAFFRLKIVDHITLVDPHTPDSDLEYLRDFILDSDIIPEKFAYEMKSNWLHCSPSEMADHFKAISLGEKSLPLLQYVKSYTFISAENLKKIAPDAISYITGFSISMGLDLNKKVMKLPVFSPILIYAMDWTTNSTAGISQKVNSDNVYEELSRPCPPTCH